jgi:hypothetical protein
MGAFTQAARPFRVITPLGPDVLLLENVEGEEGISRPFEFHLSMLSENDSISPTDLIRKPVRWPAGTSATFTDGSATSSNWDAGKYSPPIRPRSGHGSGFFRYGKIARSFKR